jgi:hypothetical protein
MTMPFFSSYLTGSGGENWMGLNERLDGCFKRSSSCATASDEKTSRKIRTNMTDFLFIISLAP